MILQQLTDCKVVLAGWGGHAHAWCCAANELPHRPDLHMYVVLDEVNGPIPGLGVGPSVMTGRCLDVLVLHDWRWDRSFLAVALSTETW